MTIAAPRMAARGDEPALSAWRLTAFSTITLPIYAAQMPLAVYLPSLYAQEFGISLTLLGTIFLLERLWGTFADPIVGLLSDRTRTRFGRRRIWIAVGALIYGFAAILLFFPPMAIQPIYLAVSLFIFYFGWSMIQIPYLAWSGEISGAYHERTRIATYQNVASSISLLFVLILPVIVDQISPGASRLKLDAMGGVIVLSLIPSLILTLRAFPDTAVPVVSRSKTSFRATMVLLLRERLLLRVLASDFAVTLGQSIRGTLFVFFLSIYMGLPQWASGMFLLQFAFGILAGPIWMQIGRWLGKHNAAVAGELTQVAINLGLLFVVPGQLGLLLVLTVAQGLAQNSGNLMLRAMVADIADKHRLESGEDRAALFFSVFSISMKAGMAAAVGIALPLVAWFGFSPTAHNSAEALRGLLLVFALGPAVAHILSAALIFGFPLDAAAHADIRRKLEERRLSTDVPLESTA